MEGHTGRSERGLHKARSERGLGPDDKNMERINERKKQEECSGGSGAVQGVAGPAIA